MTLYEVSVYPHFTDEETEAQTDDLTKLTQPVSGGAKIQTRAGRHQSLEGPALPQNFPASSPPFWRWPAQEPSAPAPPRLSPPAPHQGRPRARPGPALTCPPSHSCSYCPRWTRGWPGAASGWASPRPGPSPCSSGSPSASGCPLLGREAKRDGGGRDAGWERTERRDIWLAFQWLVGACFGLPLQSINLLLPPASPAPTPPWAVCPSHPPKNCVTCVLSSDGFICMDCSSPLDWNSLLPCNLLQIPSPLQLLLTEHLLCVILL